MKLADTLHRYIVHRHIEKYPERHIFSSQTHKYMTVSCVEGIYKKYVAMAKKQNPSLFQADSYPPHSMRHSTACHLLEAGVDIGATFCDEFKQFLIRKSSFSYHNKPSI